MAIVIYYSRLFFLEPLGRLNKNLEPLGRLNKNVDTYYCAHGAVLEYSSSGTLKIERLESQIFQKKFRSNKPKWLKQDSQNRQRSPMPEEGENQGSCL